MGEDTTEYVYIYVLIDPRDEQVRYVGKAKNLKKRYCQHISQGKNYDPHTSKSHKNAWIKSLLNLNLKPIIKEIEKVKEEDWQERETYWIKDYRESNNNLTNIADGGEGVTGSLSWDEERLKKASIKFSKILTEKYERERQILKNLNIVGIPITTSELKIIEKYKDYKKKYFLLGLLYYSKLFANLNKSNKYIVENKKAKTIRSISKINRSTSLEEIEFWYPEFYNDGLLISNGNVTEILFVDCIGDAAFFIKDRDKVIESYNHFMNEDRVIYINCEICGMPIIKKSNRQKYCEVCWKERQRELSRNSVREVRKKKKEEANRIAKN